MADKNQGGRPSKYKPEYAEQAEKLCALGATDIEVADFFDVSERTLNRWKTQFPEFCQSLKTAKEVADERVERSLYARATGYEHPEVDIRVVNGLIVQTKLRKYYAPDTTAAIFWLKNRRPTEWRDKVETVTEHKGSIEINKRPKMSRDEWLASLIA